MANSDGRKTIILTDEVYKILEKKKIHPREPFYDVIKRLVEKK